MGTGGNEMGASMLLALWAYYDANGDWCGPGADPTLWWGSAIFVTAVLAALWIGYKVRDSEAERERDQQHHQHED
jgi:hypothetical protein